MGATAVSISHCPVNIVRRARLLDNWQSYREARRQHRARHRHLSARHVLQIMRTASYLGKVASHDYKAATAAEVFAAATLGGARSLGRDDLGRLAPGAKADIIIIDLTGARHAAHGPGARPDEEPRRVRRRRRRRYRDRRRRDPHGGRTDSRRRSRRDPRARAQAAGERVWANWHKSDPLGRTHEEAAPWSFCPACYRDGDS